MGTSSQVFSHPRFRGGLWGWAALCSPPAEQRQALYHLPRTCRTVLIGWCRENYKPWRLETSSTARLIRFSRRGNGNEYLSRACELPFSRRSAINMAGALRRCWRSYASSAATSNWIGRGLNFKCTQCGKCCTGGRERVVWVCILAFLDSLYIAATLEFTAKLLYFPGVRSRGKRHRRQLRSRRRGVC